MLLGQDCFTVPNLVCWPALKGRKILSLPLSVALALLMHTLIILVCPDHTGRANGLGALSSEPLDIKSRKNFDKVFKTLSYIITYNKKIMIVKFTC